MNFTVILTDEARKDTERLKMSGEESEVRRLTELLKELSLHPQTGIGRPEELNGEWSGCWSRRISERNRLVYQIDKRKSQVIVLRAIGHYDDH